MTHTFDVAIVGNGIIAHAIALELKQRNRGLRIAIIGPSARPGAGSAAAGAMLGCFGEITHTSLKSAAGKAKFDISRRAAGRWRSWFNEIKELGSCDQPWQILNGTFVLENAVSGTLDSDNFDAMVAALEAHGEPYQQVSARDIPGINPVPSARPMRAVYLPNEGAVDSHTTHLWLHSALRRLEVTFINECAVKLTATDSQIKSVELKSGTAIHAPTVVCAAGAFTTKILDTVLDENHVQPVFAGSGISVVCNRDREVPLTHTIRSVNRGGSCGLHMVPLHGGREYLGATNLIIDRPTTIATAGLSHFLLQCAIDQIDQRYAHSQIDHWRVGNRPVSLDTFPLIGPTGVAGLFVATGTYRDGFDGSPVIAEIMADEILEGKSRYSHPFQPTRQPISVFSVEESIAEGSLHAMCTGFEASLVLPRLWPHDVLASTFPASFKKVYELLGVKDGLSPDLVPFLGGSWKQSEVFDRVKRFLHVRGISRDPMLNTATPRTFPLLAESLGARAAPTLPSPGSNAAAKHAAISGSNEGQLPRAAATALHRA